MQIIRGRRFGKSIQVQEVSASPFELKPPRPDVCQDCAKNHPPEFPHDKHSLYYQMKFCLENGRGATWTDAMAHCSDEMKAAWTEELIKRHVEVD